MENLSPFPIKGYGLFLKTVITDPTIEGGDEKRVKNMLTMAKADGEEIYSCFDYMSIEKILSENGFLIYEMLMPHDIQFDIIDPSGSDIKAFEHINYIQSVLK